ncbi:MAG: glycosyltransferase family 4 protein [Lachnospiraceae bacterium]|jgi:glycosyltransferase involved in cell wall biosynthesis|nr:glycosyltransferase family 4 protein [Lachnospiraceae bacterium]MCH4071020.1 glycosyltransferase family 4 protein [Lachnospiraceae bacterium]MCH4108091.1 glycosyltransferase family 4 protein [Lachnospiraceae bacterium]MCI1331938.1 glycosyltransferase family 4 protein [Lachnospiraceae bacterium]MCI1360654.1 glycosyltransferase family 4 protein [Lachnospiraceae bacterium]
MHIFQLTPAISTGDAVSNDAIALEAVLRDMGYTDSMIYSPAIGNGIPKSIAQDTRDLPPLSADDICLYHLAIGGPVNQMFKELPCRKVVIFHNITPAKFFEKYDKNSADLCRQGLKESAELAGVTEHAIAISEFDAQDLRKLGYTCPIDVVPILIPFDDYAKKPTESIVAEKGKKTTFLFTGRVAPNKKQGDLIEAFYYYKKNYNASSRLVIAGGYGEQDPYYKDLAAYRDALGLSQEDVKFTGHISFADLLAWYRCADVFLCLSEHEGFCVPLVEAMYFDLPIIAYDSSAVGETLSYGGLLLSDKNPLLVAGAMNRVVSDPKLRAELVANGRERLKDFDREKVAEKFRAVIRKLAG